VLLIDFLFGVQVDLDGDDDLGSSVLSLLNDLDESHDSLAEEYLSFWVSEDAVGFELWQCQVDGSLADSDQILMGMDLFDFISVEERYGEVEVGDQALEGRLPLRLVVYSHHIELVVLDDVLGGLLACWVGPRHVKHHELLVLDLDLLVSLGVDVDHNKGSGQLVEVSLLHALLVVDEARDWSALELGLVVAQWGVRLEGRIQYCIWGRAKEFNVVCSADVWGEKIWSVVDCPLELFASQDLGDDPSLDAEVALTDVNSDPFFVGTIKEESSIVRLINDFPALLELDLWHDSEDALILVNGSGISFLVSLELLLVEASNVPLAVLHDQVLERLVVAHIDLLLLEDLLHVSVHHSQNLKNHRELDLRELSDDLLILLQLVWVFLVLTELVSLILLLLHCLVQVISVVVVLHSEVRVLSEKLWEVEDDVIESLLELLNPWDVLHDKEPHVFERLDCFLLWVWLGEVFVADVGNLSVKAGDNGFGAFHLLYWFNLIVITYYPTYLF
jgi:hypothetical protein